MVARHLARKTGPASKYHPPLQIDPGRLSAVELAHLTNYFVANALGVVSHANILWSLGGGCDPAQALTQSLVTGYFRSKYTRSATHSRVNFLNSFDLCLMQRSQSTSGLFTISTVDCLNFRFHWHFDVDVVFAPIFMLISPYLMFLRT